MKVPLSEFKTRSGIAVTAWIETVSPRFIGNRRSHDLGVLVLQVITPTGKERIKRFKAIPSTDEAQLLQRRWGEHGRRWCDMLKAYHRHAFFACLEHVHYGWLFLHPLPASSTVELTLLEGCADALCVRRPDLISLVAVDAEIRGEWDPTTSEASAPESIISQRISQLMTQRDLYVRHIKHQGWLDAQTIQPPHRNRSARRTSPYLSIES